MVQLRPMRRQEFAGYSAYFIPDYAAEIARNYDLSTDVAQQRAEAELLADLPDGPETKNQCMLCIVDGEMLLGYLWYRPDDASQTVFILDFHVLPAFQGRGIGAQALAGLEADLGSQGYKQIRLRVAADNRRAFHLYEKTGFRTTGINMSKTIRIQPAA
jgi:ribosomal protein S18 acetylase RimI-like enzyme